MTSVPSVLSPELAMAPSMPPTTTKFEELLGFREKPTVAVLQNQLQNHTLWLVGVAVLGAIIILLTTGVAYGLAGDAGNKSENEEHTLNAVQNTLMAGIVLYVLCVVAGLVILIRFSDEFGFALPFVRK